MNDKIEILTKVYGYINRIKICLAFKNIAGIWKAVNDLSDYLVSIDVAAQQSSQRTECTDCGEVVSDNDATCPKCGLRNPANERIK